MSNMKRPVNQNVFDNRIKNLGRSKKPTKRDERDNIRAVHHLRISTGLPRKDSQLRLVSPLQFQYGPYAEYFLIDMVTVIKRLKFARRMKRLSPFGNAT